MYSLMFTAFVLGILLGYAAIRYYFDRSQRRKVILLQSMALFVAGQVLVYYVVR